MVVPTGVVVCGRADGPHRPIKRFRFESLNRRITDDPPYQWAVARVRVGLLKIQEYCLRL